VRRLAALLGAACCAPAFALSPAGEEFLAISKQLEPLQCEKRKLRREIALAEIEKRDTQALRRRFAELDHDPKTSKLEKRLGELEPRISRAADPEDLDAISKQQVAAFYRCQ
jgi:hypothetical protein